MRKILIFEPFLSGHRLEYIHHLYEEAARTPSNHYFFAVSDEFRVLREHFIWSISNNITFLYIDQQLLMSAKHKNKVQRIFSLVSLASKFAKHYNVDEIFFISLAEYMPWLPFFFRSKAVISGILYHIYLYDWKSKRLISQVKEAMTILSVILVKKYKHIFVLNDPVAATYLNKKFKTGKFQHLPDPFMPPACYKGEKVNEKETCMLGKNEKLFLHFGSLSYRKGTLNILHAIALLTEEEVKEHCFIFAGKIGDDIRDEFDTLTETLKTHVQIYVFDKFCEPSFLSLLCETCSVILAPYYNTSYSSGIIGYAAHFCKPVVVPDEKFIGKLVRRYHLGYLLKDNSPKSIARFIKEARTFQPIDGTRYIETHTVNDFVRKTMLFE